MYHYEVTFIVDPVLSGDEIKATEKTYSNLIKDGGGAIVNVDEMGLKQLAYPISKRSSGIYYCIEFNGSSAGEIIPKMELAFRRDERIMRFLTVKLDKYGVKYNEDKRNGLIGKSKKAKEAEEKEKVAAKVATKAPAKEAPAKEAPAKEAPVASDDLTKIEGIGPKIAEALNKAGVSSYSALAGMDAAAVREILDKADSNFAAHDPATWPQQAGLAASGNWDELKTLQDELDGGKVVSSSEEE